MGIDLDVFLRDDRALPELADLVARALGTGSVASTRDALGVDGFAFGVFALYAYPEPLLDFAHYNAQLFVGRDILSPETFAACQELDALLGVAEHREAAYHAALIDVVDRIRGAGVEAIGVVGLEEVIVGDLVHVPECEAIGAILTELAEHMGESLTREVYASALARALRITKDARVLREVKSYQPAAGVPGLGLPLPDERPRA